MNRFFKYFNFNATERRGFVVLSIGILFINLGLFAYKYFKPVHKIEHHLYALEKDAEEIDQKYSESQEDRSLPYSELKKEKKNIRYFDFDPNTLSSENWVDLGLSSKQIQVINNYRAKGGQFRKKEDLKKIYSISDQDYQRLEPYIVIENRNSDHKSLENYEKPTYEKYEKKELSISINNADTSELKQLKGIGSVLAARIVKFRDGLGGFHDLEQIKEVYGIPVETFDQIKKNLVLDNLQLHKLQINMLSADELAKHPYINKKQAQAIINYRKEHGFYTDMNVLSKNRALDQDFLRKIEPYLVY